MANVFEYLDAIRSFPGVAGHNVQKLEAFIGGFCLALELNGIHDDVPRMNHHFRDWLRLYPGLEHTNAGWGAAIDLASSDPKDAFDLFYKYLGQYRKLQPQVLAYANDPGNIHRRKRTQELTLSGVPIACPDRIDRIELVNYSPLSLYHLRIWYGEQSDDWSFLFASDGEYDVGMEQALELAAEQVHLTYEHWIRHDSGG